MFRLASLVACLVLSACANEPTGSVLVDERQDTMLPAPPVTGAPGPSSSLPPVSTAPRPDIAGTLPRGL